MPNKLSTGYPQGNTQFVDNFELRNISSNSRSSTRIIKTYLTNAICFTSSFRAAGAVRSGRTLTHWGALFALAATVTIGMQSAEANQPSDQYKLYLHSKIINYKQFICAVEVAHRESRWNWRSTNGNHYGLFQMENKQVRYMNPYTQIDWWIRYIDKRYRGQACLSLSHLKAKGWQ
jgi:hypothetical protein